MHTLAEAGERASGAGGVWWSLAVAVTLDRRNGILLLAVANFGTHPAFFPAYLTSAFTFPHQNYNPFLSELVKHRQLEIHSKDAELLEQVRRTS